MSLTLGLAIYFILWWLVLFAVLPLGVKSQVESGEVVPGTEGGAPVAPNLGRKALITTVIATVIFGTVYGLSASGIINLNQLLFGRP